MKKNIVFTGICLIVTLSTALVAFALYYIGPNNCFEMKTAAGINILKGEWIEGTMTSVGLEAIEYEKRVYARSGDGGTYSTWKDPTILSVKHRDYGNFGNNYAEVRGEWRLYK
ncbi:MAG: hypothetical protein PHG18_00750 [Bacilli bacterium]|nr:hypothetical protein [Bacilli bacterium]